ncbi:MAG: isoprenyl transferase [Candidatus Omnitrophica bacterium]|nr:isoprenyl transferase [Candidatus Omnitrophota bacterium]
MADQSPNNPKIPQHVAIIMDGNGRWANERGLARIRGHQHGVERVEEIIRVAPELGIKYLTLYAFSKENWQRPKDEVSFLMGLLAAYLDQKLEEMHRNNVVFNTIGEIGDLPKPIQEKIAQGKEKTKKNTGLVATFAFSYSARAEITRACRLIARKVVDGVLKPEDINEDLLSRSMYTGTLPDPDLLIRTSGEMRISNFLLWQISYAELYVTEKYWPDFTKEELVKAIEAFGGRERRFGRTSVSSKQ